jgi:hypothetical protein
MVQDAAGDKNKTFHLPLMEEQPVGHLPTSFAYIALIWLQFQLVVCFRGSLTCIGHPLVHSQPFLGRHGDTASLTTGTSSANEMPVSHFFVLKGKNRATVASFKPLAVACDLWKHGSHV